ncbi:MAG: hypothetical protein JWP91_3016 [Fibrobacteres bacterium]|nr:hypothetical protein [Fibrobacterota bacterium]
MSSETREKPKPKVAHAILPGQDEEGNPIFSMLVKRTYDFTANGIATRAEQDEKLRPIDEYYDMGDPQTATVKYESDLVPFKALTDVVFIGKAMATGGVPVTAMDVGIQVEGAGAKIVRVIGNRRCVFQPNRPPLFTPPEPFTEMEIRYDYAFGGKDKKSLPDGPFHYPRNDMGRGLILKNRKEIVDGLELPNIEDPADLLVPEGIVLDIPEAWPRAPMPQGLGWFQRTWYPRSFYAGSIPPYVNTDTLTKEEFLGLIWKQHIVLARKSKLPGFHTRFLQGASPGLSFPNLKGNETIRLRGLSAEGMLKFTLPGETPSLRLDIGDGYKHLDPVLHTICVRGEDRQVDLVWRGSLPYPGIEYLAEMTTLAAESD